MSFIPYLPTRPQNYYQRLTLSRLMPKYVRKFAYVGTRKALLGNRKVFLRNNMLLSCGHLAVSIVLDGNQRSIILA